MADGHRLPDRATVGRTRRLVQGVQQRPDRYGGGSRLARARVGAGEDHQQSFLRGQHRVQQQLPVFAPRVAIADPGLTGGDVVPVEPDRPRKDSVVHPEQADHPVRHRPHRQHRAHGQGAGPEVGPAGSAAERVGEQGRDLGQGELDRVARRRLGQSAELVVGMGQLPAVGRRDRGQQVQRPPEQLDPAGHRAGNRAGGGHRPDPGQALGQPADQVDVARVDVVQGQRGADEVLIRSRPWPPRAAAGPSPQPRCSDRSRPCRTAPAAAYPGPSAPPTDSPERAAVPGHRPRNRTCGPPAPRCTGRAAPRPPSGTRPARPGW